MDIPPTSSNDELRRLVANAFATLDQPPPPTLREILTAYRSKGDGDRDMLLAMLNAKTAEDQTFIKFLARNPLVTHSSRSHTTIPLITTQHHIAVTGNLDVNTTTTNITTTCHYPALITIITQVFHLLGSQHEHLPPSPYSSSGRSDSAEYSPRSRTSMAIGSLLSSGPPPPDANTDDL
ncbi:hypothetical protein H0H93_007549 [Arthromyces matolae]|nr:hypothetical protein H0H93_007549 [Arthromyces matolae]